MSTPRGAAAGTWLKEWRRRYFRLIGNKLYFSKDARVRTGGGGGGRALGGSPTLVSTSYPPPRARCRMNRTALWT